MNLLTRIPDELLTPQEPPCLSLYQPTHRHHPENRPDPVRFRNLVKALEQSLNQKYRPDEIGPLLRPFQDLEIDHNFWNHTLDGLAVFGGRGLFQIVRLQQRVPELAVVADSFHTKPLRRFLQTADRFQVLGLSRDRIKLFEGNHAVLDEVDLAPGVPRTITEALGDQLSEPHQTVAAYGGVGGDNGPMRHGHGGRKDQIELDEERFFRVVDRAILEHHSQPAGVPLILAALPEHHSHFRQVSRNPFLLSEGVKIHPDATSIHELRNRAWQLLEPEYQRRIAKLSDEFALARAKRVGFENLEQVAEASFAGRVGTLLIEADRQVPGRIDPATGEVRFGPLEHPELDDLLDDLGALVLQKGGKVVVIPVEQMPTRTGAAAICRF